MVKRGRLTRWFSYHPRAEEKEVKRMGAEDKEVKRKGAEEKEAKEKVVKRKRVQYGRRIVLRIHLRNLSGEDNEGLRKGDDVTRGFIIK